MEFWSSGWPQVQDPVDRNPPEKEKKVGRFKLQGGILATKWPFYFPLCPWGRPRGWDRPQDFILAHVSERKRREKLNKVGSSLEISVLPWGFRFRIASLNVFQGSFLRVFGWILYFHVWGSQKRWEMILFHKIRWCFWGFKKSVHLGFWKQIFTRNVLGEFGGCG